MLIYFLFLFAYMCIYTYVYVINLKSQSSVSCFWLYKYHEIFQMRIEPYAKVRHRSYVMDKVGNADRTLLDVKGVSGDESACSRARWNVHCKYVWLCTIVLLLELHSQSDIKDVQSCVVSCVSEQLSLMFLREVWVARVVCSEVLLRRLWLRCDNFLIDF